MTFSITIVALTLASQQFGPRLLRTFLRDVGNQVVLGTHVSTFLYSLLVLRTIRGSDDPEFVPHLAVTVGDPGHVEPGRLIFFIHHVATSIQASRIIANVAEDLEGLPIVCSQKPLRTRPRADGPRASAEQPALHSARAVIACTPGYVQSIDAERLMSFAREHDVVVRVRARPGAFVRRGGGLLTVAPASGKAHPADTRFHDAFIIGSERTGTQDVTFFIDHWWNWPSAHSGQASMILQQRACASIGSNKRRVISAAVRFPQPSDTTMMGASCAGVSPAIPGGCGECLRRHLTIRAVKRRGHLPALHAVGDVAPCVKRETDRTALLRAATVVAAGVRDVPLSDSDRELIAQRPGAALDVLRVPPRDSSLAAS